MAGPELPRRGHEEPSVPQPRRGTARDWPAVPAQQTALRLIMMPAPGYAPLWVESGDRVTNTSPAELSVPRALAQRITAWGHGYDSPAQRSAYYGRGLVLALRLSESLGAGASVQFYDGVENILRRL